MWFISFGTLSCATNVYAVIMMSWKAWSAAFSVLYTACGVLTSSCFTSHRTHARFMKEMKCPTVMGHSLTAMLLITESGLFYCFAEVSLLLNGAFRGNRFLY